MKYEYDELEELFDDEERLRVARMLSRARPPRVEADPSFRSGLRRQLMREAWDMANPSPSLWRRLVAPRGFAWGGAMAGLVAVALLALLFAYNRFQAETPTAQISEQPVAATAPFEVKFNEPMDHGSAEKAVKVDPPTAVRYEWSGNTLLILPASGSWASNVQYKVTVDQTAESTSGKPLAQATTAPVTTQPTPSLPPSPTPTPTPTATPLPTLADIRQVGDLATDHRFLAWSPDGQVIYAIDAQGRLSAVPTQVDQARPLTDSGVTQVALSPNGTQLAFARAGKVWTVPVGGGAPVALGGVDGSVLALGWNDGAPVWVTAEGAFSATGQLARLPAGAQQLNLSPAGDRLAYRTGGALKIADLGGGADIGLPQSASSANFLAWSPDGKAVAYQDGGQIALVDLGSGNRVNVSAQATAASWSSQGKLVLTGPAGLSQVGADGSGLRVLGSGVYETPQWAPDGSHLAFGRSGGLWMAQVLQPGGSGALSALDAGRAVVDSFMRARVAGNADQAAARLDASGKAAYAGDSPQLTSAGLSRYYVVAAQSTGSGQHFVVRLIFSKDKFETQYQDEALTLQPAPDGSLLVHAAVAGARQDLGKGPLLTSAEFSSGRIKLQFDSNLDPKTAADAVQVVGATSGSQVAAPTTFEGPRTVTVDTSQLKAGGSYRLTVQTTLKDVNGRPLASAYSLDFAAPR